MSVRDWLYRGWRIFAECLMYVLGACLIWGAFAAIATVFTWVGGSQ